MRAGPWEAGQMYHGRTYPICLSHGANCCPRRAAALRSFEQAHLPRRQLIRGVHSSASAQDRNPADEPRSEFCGCGEKAAAQDRTPPASDSRCEELRGSRACLIAGYIQP